VYAHIHAKSEDTGSHGKASWVNTGSGLPSINLMKTPAEHLGSPPWHVLIQADDSREITTGDRGDPNRRNAYSFELELTPGDLAAIVISLCAMA